MRLAALLVLFAVPLLEIGVLVKVGQWLGLWPTLGIVIVTAVLGAAVIANQGFNSPLQMQEAMRRGETPLATMFDGALAWFSGFLLLTPGFIADATGLLLLVGPIRRAAARWVAKQFFGMADVDVEIDTREGTTRAGRRSRQEADGRNGREGSERDGFNEADGPIIEGDFRRIGERTVDPNRRRPDRPDDVSKR